MQLCVSEEGIWYEAILESRASMAELDKEFVVESFSDFINSLEFEICDHISSSWKEDDFIEQIKYLISEAKISLGVARGR